MEILCFLNECQLLKHTIFKKNTKYSIDKIF